MNRILAKREALARKCCRVRKRVEGSDERPRLSVYRSEKHIYAQVINDRTGKTLASCSSAAKDLRGQLAGLKPLAVAAKVGETLAAKATAAGVTAVVFDRGGRMYAGRVKALADGARSKGLQF